MYRPLVCVTKNLLGSDDLPVDKEIRPICFGEVIGDM
jgi:hypothetical protein